ncbi:hypothetical protein B0H66DRAFT_530261 [Apodospora peruviana]|uniref:Uncharacterized protein n=1 Tax=Apodospora peruviana TaxID=516989 RepID=A0AAE0MBE3_9PEZI|nr:hypothetical protein B0H66DRAFT_530261 [Apodospora peruviana]
MTTEQQSHDGSTYRSSTLTETECHFEAIKTIIPVTRNKNNATSTSPVACETVQLKADTFFMISQDSTRRALRDNSSRTILSHPEQFSVMRFTDNGEFYKTFTRPVAKCLLLAVLTYQLIYWGWTKVEMDEIKENRQAEIAELEQQVKKLQETAKAAATPGLSDSDNTVSAPTVDGGEKKRQFWFW